MRTWAWSLRSEGGVGLLDELGGDEHGVSDVEEDADGLEGVDDHSEDEGHVLEAEGLVDFLVEVLGLVDDLADEEAEAGGDGGDHEELGE